MHAWRQNNFLNSIIFLPKIYVFLFKFYSNNNILVKIRASFLNFCFFLFFFFLVCSFHESRRLMSSQEQLGKETKPFFISKEEKMLQPNNNSSSKNKNKSKLQSLCRECSSNFDKEAHQLVLRSSSAVPHNKLPAWLQPHPPQPPHLVLITFLQPNLPSFFIYIYIYIYIYIN